MRQVMGLAVLSTLIAAPFFVNAEESLRSSTEFQPIVLAQAGSTGGTIGKENRSVSGSEQKKPTDSGRSATRKTSTRTGCGRIVGTWRWPLGQEVVFTSGGSMRISNGDSGRWTCADGIVVATYISGYIDRITLSADGSQVSIANNRLGTYSGARK